MITLDQNRLNIRTNLISAQKLRKNGNKTTPPNPAISLYKSPSADLMKIYFLGAKNNNKVSFRGAPWRIDLLELGVPSSGPITAENAIKIFEKFKIGNYLDIGDDIINPSNKLIRESNLEFLDRVEGVEEKIKFINHYKELTGFPDLKEVSSRIKSTFVSAVTAAESELSYWSNTFKVVRAGYDGICSVGRNKALPGSDLDKAFVILKGSDYNDVELVNRFKGELWENTDQRILSYNHDFAAFPQVYTLDQVNRLFASIKEKTDSFGLHRPIELDTPFWERLIDGPRTTTQFNRYSSLGYYNENYVDANPFFIRLCKEFPYRYYNKLDVYNPSKENIKNFGFLIETLREGEYFGKFGTGPFNNIESQDAYKLANLSQIKALKNRSDAKPKRLARESLQNDFESWSTDKQYRFITTLIKGSCANNNEFTTEFPEYFRCGEDHFAPLIEALIK